MNELAKELKITTVIKDASFHGGGMLAVAMPLHNYFYKNGSNSTLLCSEKPYESVANFWKIGKLGLMSFFLPRTVIGNVVHIHGIWNLFELFSFLVARLRGSKVVISPHGSLEPWAFRSKKVKKKIAWWLYQKKILQHADLLVVNSQQEYINIRELGLNKPVAIIPNGIIRDGYESVKAKQVKRNKVILYFSRLDKKKGIELLLESWSKIENKYGYQLHIQGYGGEGYKKSLMKLVSELELESDVKFLEPLYGEERWLSFFSSSIYILPSYSENFGITVAEALLSGLPSITTNAMPWNDLPEFGIGWSIECNVLGVTEALRDAIELKTEDLDDMRKRAIDYADSRFCWEDIAMKYQSVYSWVLTPDTNEIPRYVKLKDIKN